MFKIFFLALFCSAISISIIAQIQPKEGAELNYRLIGFLFPPQENVSSCRLEIAKGNYYSEDSFKKNIIKTITCEKSRVIAEVPSWGVNYTWRIEYVNKQSKKAKSELHHFSTLIIPEVDTANVCLRILHKAEKYKDAYVFLDNSAILYDMKGSPVWFLPDRKWVSNDPRTAMTTTRDVKLSCKGTITYLLKDEAYEVNYDGALLWKGPNDGKVSGDSSERYHHELTRLSNGHYMVLGDERVIWKPRIRNDKMKNDNSDVNIPLSPFGTIIEYDEKGKVVWSWKSSGYFLGSDINYYNPSHKANYIDVHENAFYFDEKDKVIYVGFKNIDRIIKLKYPEGVVMNVYGAVYKPNSQTSGTSLFCGQHSISISHEGRMCVFNNNSCETDSPAKIIMIQEADSGKDEVKKIWEYECKIEANAPKRYFSGGDVRELEDNSFFTCTGDSYSKVFIVSRNKAILWSALPEKFNPDEKKWEPLPQYRASIIENNMQLERLILNREIE